MADGGKAAAPDAGLQPLDDGGRAALAGASQALAVVIRLTDREADAELIAGMQAARAGDMLAEMLPPGPASDAGRALQAALDDLGAPDAETLDALAADYADCFLTHGYRLSPHGSVWLTEERLERQQPMFDVRDWYAHYGLAAPDWRLRPDDHLVHELQFVHYLLTLQTADAAWDAAVFLDLHVLNWVPEYGAQMVERCVTPYLQATGQVVATLPGALRDLLADLTGVAVNIAARPGDTPNPKAPEQQMYLPGAQPSW